ncbi:MAG: hypothetical protein AB7I41_20855 [Candidatus Sericytochromatia bacterium]
MQVNPQKQPMQTITSKGPVQGSAPPAQGSEHTDAIAQAKKLDLSNMQDQHSHSILPGGCVIHPTTPLFKGPETIIEKTLDRTLGKYPGARQDALESFHNQIDNMTPGELDDMKDAIVKRMSSPDSSQRDRDMLQKMYEITDAVAENRLPPHVGIGGSIDFPKPFPPRPFPPKPIFPPSDFPPRFDQEAQVFGHELKKMD